MQAPTGLADSRGLMTQTFSVGAAQNSHNPCPTVSTDQQRSAGQTAEGQRGSRETRSVVAPEKAERRGGCAQSADEEKETHSRHALEVEPTKLFLYGMALGK